jgi:hypothetical protein
LAFATSSTAKPLNALVFSNIVFPLVGRPFHGVDRRATAN